MVSREAERIEVFVNRDDGVEVVVVLVGWAWEYTFDNLPRDGDGVVLLEVKLSRSGSENV